MSPDRIQLRTVDKQLNQAIVSNKFMVRACCILRQKSISWSFSYRQTDRRPQALREACCLEQSRTSQDGVTLSSFQEPQMFSLPLLQSYMSLPCCGINSYFSCLINQWFCFALKNESFVTIFLLNFSTSQLLPTVLLHSCSYSN